MKKVKNEELKNKFAAIQGEPNLYQEDNSTVDLSGATEEERTAQRDAFLADVRAKNKRLQELLDKHKSRENKDL